MIFTRPGCAACGLAEAVGTEWEVVEGPADWLFLYGAVGRDTGPDHSALVPGGRAAGVTLTAQARAALPSGSHPAGAIACCRRRSASSSSCTASATS